ncbi:MAG: glycosyltransferase family 2 protein [Spirochaetaceae bacterium]|jgi:dolichol-phosphate mannosyltransferase|nr:glycosyltransferase family 2 protein [Spirochaetaceae bacterium]
MNQKRRDPLIESCLGTEWGGGSNLLVCIPTYNEAENIAPFITAVFDAAPAGADILVIDDNSPDGTAGIVEKLIQKYNERLSIIKRPGKQGGASAFLQSFEYGLKHNYAAMLAMDADFSHDPKYIPQILSKAGEYDVVIGSRLVKGGGIEKRSLARNIISAGASLYCRAMLTPGIKDWTGGYNLWTRKALEKIDVTSIFTRAYSFQIEMKYKAFRAGCKICEIPVIFPDRTKGVSKMTSAYFITALLDVWRIKFFRIKNTVEQMFKFALTGGLGTITNLALFFLLVDILGLPPIPVSIGCFLISGAQNYIIHHKWSFVENTRGTPPSIKKFFTFIFFALLGLAVNIFVMNTVLRHIALPYKTIAQACGILAGMIINFITAKLIVFRRQRAGRQTK